MRTSCLSLSLVLTACASPGLDRTPPVPSSGQLKLTANVDRQTVLATDTGDRLRVSFTLPEAALAPPKAKGFGIKSALPAAAAYVRLTVKALDFTHDYSNNGGITLNGVGNLVALTGTTATLTVDQLPKGKDRLVIAQVYDMDGKELTSFRAMGLFHSQAFMPTGSLRFSDENLTTDVIEQTVSRRNLPLLSLIEMAIDAKNAAFLTAIETHLDQLAAEFDKMVYGPNTPGTTFNVDPQRIDPAEIYADLNNKILTSAINLDTGLPAYFSGNQATFIDPLSNITVFLATPTGFQFTQDLTVQLDDPSSTSVTVPSNGLASPVSASLNNITRGTRRLSIFDPTGKLLGHTTVSVDPDTGISFANGAGVSAGQPLVLLGPETGVSLSSVSLAAAAQAVPLTLNGVGYSTTQADNTVRFGASTVAITGATGTTINLNTPDLIGGTYPVTVTRLGIVSNSQNFNLLPSVTSLSVSNGILGSSVILTGTGFDPTAANNTVKFGSTLATVTASAPNGHSLTVTVPPGIWGSQNLTATVGNQQSTEVQPYAVKPNIASLSSSNGVIGSSVVITGTGFDPTPGNNTVKFGTTAATVNSATPTQLVVVVPPGIWDANNISVKVGSQTSNQAGFEVTPEITGTSPSSGIPGIFITLNGTGFDPTPANNTVKFGSIILGEATASVQTATTNSLTVIVFPVIVGNLPVTVKVGNQTSSGSIFTSIFPPAISSFSQNSGTIGSSLQINGSDFDPIAANNVVKFGSTPATVTGVTGTTQLTVTVPPGISGTQNVTVQVGANTNSGVHNFSVTPAISSLSVATGRVGSSVTLTGTGFSSTPASNTVLLGAKPATIQGGTSNTSLTVTVPGDSLDFGLASFTVAVAGQTSNGMAYTAMAATPCVQPGFTPSGTDSLKFSDCLDTAPPGPVGIDFTTNMSNNVSLTTDRFGQALSASDFSGVDSYKRVNFNLGPDNFPVMTMSVWARFVPIGPINTATDVYALFSHDDGPFDRDIDIDNRSGSFGWSAFGGINANVIGGSPVTQGQWTMLTAVYDNPAGTLTFFVDGTQVTQSNVANMSTGFPYFLLGKNPGFPADFPFPGQIDDVVIFNKALSPAEVTKLYETTKP